MLRDYLNHARGFSPAAKLFLVGQFLTGIGQGTLWVLRNLYLHELNFDAAFIGRIMSMTAVGTLVIAIPLSFLLDRMRMKPVLIAGCAALGAGLAGTALWPRADSLMISAFLVGAGTPMLTIAAAPFFMRVSSAVERPYLFAVGMALHPAAGLLGTGLVWVLAKSWGEGAPAQKEMLLIASGFCAAAAAVFLAIREERPSPHPGPAAKFDLGLATKLFLPAAITGLGAGLTIPFINLYFKRRFELGAGRISAIFSFAQIIVFFAFLAAPIIGRRFGAVRTIVACQLLSIPFFLLMAFTMSPVLAAAGFLGRHALMNMVGPVGTHFAMEVAPPAQRSFANGFREVTWDSMWMFGTALGGWMIDHTRFIRDGFTVCMLVTIGIYIVASGMFYAFWKSSKALRAEPAISGNYPE